MFQFAKPNPAVHNGGIKAVAIATPNITLATVPRLALAITRAIPPKKAIRTSRISGAVRASNSDDSSLNGKNLKNKKAVRILRTTITAKFFKDLFRVSISFTAKEYPIPKIGPIRGEINMAPITTAVELAFKPTDAIKTEHIKIHDVCPLKSISSIILAFVAI